MKATAETKQPVTIDMDRREAQALVLEIKNLAVVGTPIPRLSELQSILEEAERRFRSAEYQGPG